MLEQDTMLDFYPPNVGAFQSYVPSMSDAAPQAATIPANVAARGMPGAMSNVVWALVLVGTALLLMHLADR